MITSNSKRLNPEIFTILNKFLKKLNKRNVSIVKVILFGSQARGTAGKESDIDVLVVVKKLDNKVREAIIDEAYNTSLEEDVDLIALACDVQEYNSPLFRADTFYKNVEKEGVVVG